VPSIVEWPVSSWPAFIVPLTMIPIGFAVATVTMSGITTPRQLVAAGVEFAAAEPAHPGLGREVALDPRLELRRARAESDHDALEAAALVDRLEVADQCDVAALRIARVRAQRGQAHVPDVADEAIGDEPTELRGRWRLPRPCAAGWAPRACPAPFDHSGRSWPVTAKS
jgi:hypothetical protein